MNFELEIQKAFERLKQRDVFCFIAKVLEVDKGNGVCKVDDGELEYTDVRLSSIIDGNDQKCFVFPKVGSTILVEPINEDLKQLYVSKYSEVESISGLIENTSFLIDAEGFNLMVENALLKITNQGLSGGINDTTFLIDDEGFEQKVENTLLKIVAEGISGGLNNTDFSITNSGYAFNRNGEKLKTVLNDWITEFGKLCDELNLVLVSIGTSPNIPNITLIKTQVTTAIKNRLNTILTE